MCVQLNPDDEAGLVPACEECVVCIEVTPDGGWTWTLWRMLCLYE